MKRLTRALAATLALLLNSATAHAQVYGAGNYGQSTYGNGNVSLGPITLPVTGPQLLAIVSAALIAVALGWFVHQRSKRKDQSEV